MAQTTSIEVINDHLANLNGGDKAVTVLNGGADFVGFDIGSSKLNAILDLAESKSLEDALLNTNQDVEFKKDKHFSDQKVKRIVKKLKKDCDKFVKQINQRDQYYCSDVFVYMGDTPDAQLEGHYHKASGQKGFDYLSEKPGTQSQSETRRRLSSNNEEFANYEVYVIGVMEK